MKQFEIKSYCVCYRIFPTGDEETDDINETRRTVKVQSDALKNEMSQMEIILAETGTKLEDKNLLYDILR